MGLSELTKKMVDKTLSSYCDKRVPAHVRHQVQLKYLYRGDAVILYEERPKWNDPSKKTKTPVARFKFDSKTKKWTLYCCDRNSKWHIFELLKPSTVFNDLLDEVEKDVTGIFWG